MMKLLDLFRINWGLQYLKLNENLRPIFSNHRNHDLTGQLSHAQRDWHKKSCSDKIHLFFFSLTLSTMADTQTYPEWVNIQKRVSVDW